MLVFFLRQKPIKREYPNNFEEDSVARFHHPKNEIPNNLTNVFPNHVNELRQKSNVNVIINFKGKL